MPISHEDAVTRFRRMVGYREEGQSLEDIARLEGVSRQRVLQILEKGEPKPPGRPSGADLLKKDLNTMNTQLLERQDIHSAVREVADSDQPNAMTVHAVVVPNRMAFATLRPSDMEDLFFVSAYSEVDPRSPAPQGHGYQRDLMTVRKPGIARYFLKDDNQYLITPIIVSVRLDDEDNINEFIQLWNAGDIDGIHERWFIGVVSVVDGQHRFIGLVHAHHLDPDFDPVVPVMLYFGLGYEDEAELFDTINSTQRKLPKALIEVTKGDITQAHVVDHAQFLRTVAFGLARDKDSVWYDQVNMTGAYDRTRPVTYEGLRRSTENMLTPEVVGRLKSKSLDPEQVVKDYWSMVAEACPEAWNERPREEMDSTTGEPVEVAVKYRLKELVGVASVAKLGRDILLSALEAPFFNERMSDLVSLLSEVDWEKNENNPWMAPQAGFAGQRELYTLLHNLVYLGIKPGEAVDAEE